MRAMLISFAVGLVVGVAYGLLGVKSPAPPLVALVGLLGMVWGEQTAERFFCQGATFRRREDASGRQSRLRPVLRCRQG